MSNDSLNRITETIIRRLEGLADERGPAYRAGVKHSIAIVREELSKPAPVVEREPECPFCGYVGFSLCYAGQPATSCFVECLKCGARGPRVASVEATGGKVDWDAAIEGWCRRTTPPAEAQPDVVERVANVIGEVLVKRGYVYRPKQSWEALTEAAKAAIAAMNMGESLKREPAKAEASLGENTAAVLSPATDEPSVIPDIAEITPCPYVNGWSLRGQAYNADVGFMLQRYPHFQDLILFEDGKPSRCFRFRTQCKPVCQCSEGYTCYSCAMREPVSVDLADCAKAAHKAKYGVDVFTDEDIGITKAVLDAAKAQGARFDYVD